MSLQNPLTYLELCQRVQQECGVSGSLMSTTAGVSGEALRIATWVASAALEIQELHPDFGFLRSSVSFSTDTTKVTYKDTDCGLTAGIVGSWDKHSFRSYLTSAGVNGEIFTPYMPFQAWRDTYFIGAMRAVRSQPIVMTITPTHELGFGPIAATGYTITGNFYLSPRPLVNNDDTLSSVIVAAGGTAIQGQTNRLLNMAIMYQAMKSYGAYEHAAEIFNFAEAEYNKVILRIDERALPEIQVAGGLA